MPTSSSIVSVEATWERSALDKARDTTALRLTIRGHRPATVERHRAPIDIALVLDRSGSMRGDKIDLAKQAANASLGHLIPDDQVAVVTFDNEIDVLQALAPADPATRARIRSNLDQVDARGGTALSDGWLTGCQQLATAMPSHQNRLQRAILLTDGQANQGITDVDSLSRHASELWARGISTTTMGVGIGFDEVLLTSMAEAGGGNFHYVERPDQFAAIFTQEIGGLTELAALHPRLEITLPRGLRAHLLNRFPTQRVEKTITVNLRDLIDRDQIDLVFVVTHRGNLDASSPLVRAHMDAADPLTGEAVRIDAAIPPLAFVSREEAAAAPVNHSVRVAREIEQALLEQREALRLDREGRHVESRQRFAAASMHLADVDAAAMAAGYAGIAPNDITSLQETARELRTMAAAPAMAYEEDVYKRRAAAHAERSRGGRRDID